MKFLAAILPTLLKVFDSLPLKGYRNPIAFALAGVFYVLGAKGVLPASVADSSVSALLMITGYLAAQH